MIRYPWGIHLNVIQILQGEAVVKRHEGNAQHTGIGLKLLDQWLGKTEWGVVHFNWGLWDICYRLSNGERDAANGRLTTTLEQYEENLDQLVIRLKKTDATLIWARTTIVPEGATGRFVGDEKKYNDVAAEVMQKHVVDIDNLYALTAGFPPDMFVGPADVHYTEKGYRRIAEQVADRIRAVLERPAT